MIRSCLSIGVLFLVLFSFAGALQAQDRQVEPGEETTVEKKEANLPQATRLDRTFTTYEKMKMNQIRQARNRATRATLKSQVQGVVQPVEKASVHRQDNRTSKIKLKDAQRKYLQKRARQYNTKNMRILKERSLLLEQEKARKIED